MAKIKYEEIQSLEQSWENFAGSSVEKFIKKELKNRAGYIYRSSSKEGDYYYLYGFNDYEQFDSWANGDSTITPLFRVQLPNIENDTFSVNLSTNSNTSQLINLGDGIIIGIKYTSVKTNPITGISTDTYNDGTLIISRSANGSPYIEVARLPIQPTPYASVEYKDFDLTPYLADGENKIRMRVEDNVNGSISTNLNFPSIINTTLSVENATPKETPLNSLQFHYYIQGQVSKTLHVNISQDGVSETFTYAIGDSSYTEIPYTTPLMSIDNLNSGIITVESWLTVDGTELTSTRDISQFYYTKGDITNTIIILNNVNKEITNYTNQHLFDMTLYNQGADVEIKIQSNDGNSEFLKLQYNNCQTGKVYSVYATTEIESTADSIDAMVLVNSDKFNCSPYSISIDNKEKMSPVAGANFVLNPKLRSNSETNPNTIINTVSDTTVNSTFTGFDFINDGWVNDDDNIGVLRIPSNHTLTINYDALDAVKNGTSIELDYKVYNIFNDNDEVVKIYTTNADNAKLGLVMNATEAAFYTTENQTKRDQDVIFQEGVRTHMVINIVPNLSDSGLNYIRIFINGILNREMLYTDSDIFKSGTVSMVFGSENCNLDIYGIRVYKTGLSAYDIRQNYISSLPTSSEKIAFKTANDILSSNGTISYDKACVKYNTLVWTGLVPSYSTGNKTFTGKLNINIIDDAEHSGTITNLQIKGQGSSSRGYWKWNHQFDLNKIDGNASIWTDGNGVEHTDGYSLTSDDVAALKLVGKLNWASSMQSHKIGATAIYNDFWKEIVGGNSITKTEGFEKARVTVHQKPFLYFIKETESSQPVFYGFSTFGSAKFDKPTFGYDKSVFPDYLILEGSDNGMPLTLRQVPWLDDEVTYNSDEEYYEYAGQGNLDYGMGNQSMISYFKDGYNFTYLHSLYLTPFTGSISENADKKYQYWDTTTKNVFRYDYITQSWVNGGITKENGEYTVLNLETQTGLLRSSYNSDEEYNNAVISWRKNDFKNKVDVYYNSTDVLFSMALLKLIGASDNRCKNTYEYIDPVTHKICLAQDDMDTLMLTDNVGRKTKPYYVEEYDLDEQNKPYFNGSDNVFYNLMDKAFDAEERAMMKQILTLMTNKFGSVDAAIEHYFFSTQEYFPAVAYNETARLLYEEASVKQSKGVYVNGTPAISQSLGDQLQAEKQWWNRRIPYMESWSSTDPFYTRSTTEPNLQFRSMINVLGNNPNYVFNLTPWQWLYPKVGTGQFLSSDNTRVKAGEVYNTVNMATDGNTDTFIYGSDYYTSFGEFGGVSLNETFNLVGNRLLEFSADSRNVENYNFRPSKITVACPNLKYFCIYGCSTAAGSLDLSASTKLETVDLRGTSISSVTLPNTGTLTTAYLPNLTSISLVDSPNLTNLSIEAYTNLVSLTTDKNDLALDVLQNATNLKEVNLVNIDITTDSNNAESVLSVLSNADVKINATGQIYIDKSLTNIEKAALEDKFGKSIWDSNSDFRITFIVTDIESITLTPSSLTYGKYAEGYIDVSYEGNNDASYEWSISETDNPLTLSREKNKITIIAGNLISCQNIKVTYTITKIGGTTISNSVDLMLNPYTFSLGGTKFEENPTIEMVYGSSDSSITDATGWEITCSEDASYTVKSVTINGGTAVVNGNKITSIKKTTLSSNGEYKCSVVITVDNLDLTYNFTIKTKLVKLSVNSISDVNAINGSGSAKVTFTHTDGYDSYITIQSVTVSSGNTNTISDITLNGCKISFSGYTATAAKVLTVVYKVNNGSNCTTTANFNVVYVKEGPTVIMKYTKMNSVSEDNVSYHYVTLFSSYANFAVPADSDGYLSQQVSCNVDYKGNEYDMLWDSTLHCYVYNENGTTLLKVFKNTSSKNIYLYINDTLYDSTYDVVTVTMKLTNDLNYFNYAWKSNSQIRELTINGAERIGTYNSYMLESTYIEKLTIGKEALYCGSNMFGSYSRETLKEIVCNATTAPSITQDTFYNMNYFCGNLIYPEGSDYSSWLLTDDYYLGSKLWNTIEDNNIFYRLDETSHNATVAGISIKAANKDCVIPASITYNGVSYTVNKMNKLLLNTTYSNITINSLTIPASVTSISKEFKSSYLSINQIIIDDDNTVYYDGDSNCIIEKQSETLIYANSSSIPNTVKIINSYCFANRSDIKTIELPDSVETISDNAFYSSKITSISGNNVKTVGEKAFYYCSQLSSISFPNVVTIDNYAFHYCQKLTSVNIQNVNKIGNNAFQTCSILQSISLPNATEIGESCFIYCYKLTTVEMPKVYLLQYRAFYNCTALTSISLPELTKFGNEVFSGCTSLTSVSIPKVTVVGTNEFNECSMLTSIDLSSAKELRNYAFYKCSSLSSISLSDAITTIGTWVFYSCTKLSKISINSSAAPTINYNSWGTSTDTAGYSSGTDNVLYVPQGATGYDTTDWTSYLLNADYGKFTISYTL